MKMHVARQSIEPCHLHWGLGLARGFDRCRKLRAPSERVMPLAGFNLGILTGDLKTFSFTEPGKGRPSFS